MCSSMSLKIVMRCRHVCMIVLELYDLQGVYISGICVMTLLQFNLSYGYTAEQFRFVRLQCKQIRHCKKSI